MVDMHKVSGPRGNADAHGRVIFKALESFL